MDKIDITTRGAHIGSGPDKTGAHIDLFFAEDTFHPNRGFVEDRVTAWDGETCVGYLTAAYVNRGVYEHHNPTVWNHFSNFEGMSVGLMGQDPRSFEDEKAASFRRSALHALELYNHPDPGSYAAFEEVARGTRRYANLMRKREEFFAFHMEQTYVGFIDTGLHAEDRSSHRLSGNFTGRGIAKLMYVGMAHIQAERGRTFRASGLQQPEAAFCWDSMQKAGWVNTMQDGDKTRLYLDSTRVPEIVFCPASAQKVEGPSF